MGKSKKRCGKTFGGKKNCLGGNFWKNFKKKNLRGNFRGEVYFGGRVVGEECWEIKKKLWKFFWGGEFWGDIGGKKFGALFEAGDQGPVALTVGVVLGPVLNLSKSFQINCVKR